MGLFNIFKKKEEKKDLVLVSPVNGELLDIANVPDEVFAQKMMGDGFAIKTNDGLVVSPVDAEVQLVFETKHAIGLKTESGLEMLIHFGVDTVKLKGEGFEVFVEAGDKVKAGDKLMQVNLDYIKENAKSDISPIIFTNLEEGKVVKVDSGKVTVGEEGRIKLV